MSTTSQNPACAVCGQPMAVGQQDCLACGASRRWQQTIQAIEFTAKQFTRWGNERIVSPAPAKLIFEDLLKQGENACPMAREGRPLPDDLTPIFSDECWNCRTPISPEQQHCHNCGVPTTQLESQILRFWRFTCSRIKTYCDSGQLPLAQAHACMNDAKSRVAALRSRLEKDRVDVASVVRAEAVEEPSADCASQTRSSGGPSFAAAMAANVADRRKPANIRVQTKPPQPPRPLWEIILDPRTIQWLLGLGGVLLVLGLVIWLATLGIFKDPMVVAAALGIGNAAVLGGGWAMIRLTRYQMAGRAITLLACLVMPLNLWFYHANNLVTLDGHLWVAALVCCVLYLASALALRDHLFVYVFNGGIAMTGLLMLADMGRFWEIASPAALLVVLGLISIHVERAFPEIEGPFSRRRFGSAFFQSGQALLMAGLTLILGAQLAGDWLYQPLFQPIYQRWQLGPPAIVAEPWGQYLALALVLAGSYAFFYSDIVVRRLGLYVYLGVFTFLWAEMLVIELVADRVPAEATIIALALTGLAANLLQPKLLRWQKPLPNDKQGNMAATALSLVRAGQPLGLFLSTVPVLLGLLLHLRATYVPLNNQWLLLGGEHYTVTWMYVLAMLVTAVTCRVGAHLYRHSLPWLVSTYFFGTAAATLMGLAGLLSVVGIKTWDEMAPIMMVVPILYMIAARLYRGHTQEAPLVWVAHAATGVMIAAVLAASLHLTPQHIVEPLAGKSLNLLLAAFFAEATLFYALAAAFRKQGVNVYLGTAAACGALWQLLQYWQVGAEYYTLIFAILGFGLLVGYRLAMLEWTGLVEPAFQCANALMSLSFVAAGLITLSRLATRPDAIHWSLLFLLLALIALSLLAAWLVKHDAWRRWYIVLAIAEAGLAFFTLHVLSLLTLWQKLEIFSIVVGIALLVVGHIVWRREDDRQSDLVTFSMLFGSILVGLPLLIAVMIHRCRPMPEFSTLNELGMFTAGIVLLATGFVFQLRATTITGAGLLVVYLVSLLLFINMLENVQTVSIWLTIGGGVIFTTGILLSVYRDRLLTLPDKVMRREGVFRVLSWR